MCEKPWPIPFSGYPSLSGHLLHFPHPPGSLPGTWKTWMPGSKYTSSGDLSRGAGDGLGRVNVSQMALQKGHWMEVGHLLNGRDLHVHLGRLLFLPAPAVEMTSLPLTALRGMRWDILVRMEGSPDALMKG